MRIGELARASGVSTKTIRYYEEIRVLPEPARTAAGYRDYEESFLERLSFIRAAQRLGVTLLEIREILQFREQGEAPCEYVREVLDSQLEGLERRIEELEWLRDQLTAIASEANRSSPSAVGVCHLIESVGQKQGAAPNGAT